MYLFPVSKDEAHVKIAENKITVRTYGLPWIFWGYALASLAVIVGMYLAVKAPLEKLKSVGDGIDQLIYYGLCSTMALIPFTLISFFFFEKKITRENNKLTLSYHLFGIKFWQKTIQLNPTNRFTLNHFLNSPNMARIENKDELSGFQNKGYFELFAINHQNQRILIDRHSRKVDLEKLMHLLDAGTLNE
jgi:hypothetical protein